MRAPQTTPRRSTRAFLLGGLLVALLVAGGLSYLASSSPDGLDSVARHGCTAVETPAGEQLEGSCLAKDAESAGEHHTAGSPLADYGVFGVSGTVGIAGVIGVLVTLVLAGGLFTLLARHRPAAREASGAGTEPSAHQER